MRKLIVVSIAALVFTNAVKIHGTRGVGPNDEIDDETKKEFGRFLGKYPQSFKNIEDYNLRATIYKNNKDEIDRFNREDAQRLGWEKGEN